MIGFNSFCFLSLKDHDLSCLLFSVYKHSFMYFVQFSSCFVGRLRVGLITSSWLEEEVPLSKCCIWRLCPEPSVFAFAPLVIYDLKYLLNSDDTLFLWLLPADHSSFPSIDLVNQLLINWPPSVHGCLKSIAQIQTIIIF
jgi:hypothetical protein